MESAKSFKLIFLVSFLFFYQFALNNVCNTLTTHYIQDFHLSMSQVGWIGGTFFYGNIFFLIPAGLIVDRYGVKNVLFFANLISALLFATTVLCSNTTELALVRLLMGFCSAFGFIGCIRVAVSVINPEKISRATGMIVTMGMLGAFIVQSPFALLINLFNWQIATLIFAAFGVLISFIILYGTNRVKQTLFFESTGLEELKRLKKVFFNSQNVLCGLYASLMNLPIYMLGAVWGVPYLTNVGNFTTEQAATISGMLFIGMMVGSPIVGMLSDFLKTKKVVMVNASILSILVMALIISKQTGFYIDIGLFFLLGLITSAQVLSYPIVIENNPKDLSGVSTSVISILSLLGGALIQPIFGALLNHYAIHHIITGGSYSSSIKALMITFIVALGLSLFIKEKHNNIKYC